MAENEYILEVKNLCQHFSSGHGKNKMVVKAVDDVSFAVRRAETFGLVGESGCGKTTTGRTIIRLYDPTGGEVLFDGRDISGKMTRDLRSYLTSNISMIFQDPIESLNPKMTIEEIVGEGLKVRGQKDRDEIHRQVVEMLEKVGLVEEHATRYPHEFSGGQRQRIGIARALIMQPEFIVADEPISALDVSIRAQVLNLLNDLKKSRGLTYLFIAHDLSVVRFISDRIAVIHKGRIVELSEAEELFRHPLHPYTKSLLSAVPNPDPAIERNKKLVVYDPSIHDYSTDKPQWVEIIPGHFVYGNEKELDGYREELAKKA